MIWQLDLLILAGLVAVWLLTMSGFRLSGQEEAQPQIRTFLIAGGLSALDSG